MGLNKRTTHPPDPLQQSARSAQSQYLNTDFKHSEQQRHFNSAEHRQSIKWIQGLRGLSSFLIYWHHHQLWAHNESSALAMELPFGFHSRYYFATFPFIRTVFSGGHLAVAILFVLSGFASSIQPLLASYNKDYIGAADIASSALSRRWLRLYVPFAITSFMFMSIWYVPVLGDLIRPTSALGSWTQEAQRWLREFWSYTYVFSDLSSPWSRYHDHMWTLALELRGSLTVHIVLLATTRWNTTLRVMVLTIMTLYFLVAVDGYAFFSFFFYFCLAIQ